MIRMINIEHRRDTWTGLFDQIEGLRWVKKNIKYFGDDPNCVTIVWESAGRASVAFLILAPQAQGKVNQNPSQSARNNSFFVKLNFEGLFHLTIGESVRLLEAI